jgi:hypothetical protein
MIPGIGLILGSTLAKMTQNHCSLMKVIALFWPLIISAGLLLLLMPHSLAAVVNRYWIGDVQGLGVLYLLGALIVALSWFILQREMQTNNQN